MLGHRQRSEATVLYEYKPQIAWPVEDDQAAAAEGWGLIEAQRDGVPARLEIQRIDDPDAWRAGDPETTTTPRFESDSDAVEYVIARAFEGSDLHARAVELTIDEDPLVCETVQRMTGYMCEAPGCDRIGTRRLASGERRCKQCDEQLPEILFAFHETIWVRARTPEEASRRLRTWFRQQGESLTQSGILVPAVFETEQAGPVADPVPVR
jgi:hypothetical protein